MKYKGILLDIDGTLYDYEAAHKAALAAALELAAGRCALSRARCVELFREAREAVHLRLAGTAASHSRLLYFQGLLERAGTSPLKHARELSEKYWDELLSAMILRPGAAEFLAAASREAKICLLTDLTTEIQYRKVERMGLSAYASSMVTSEEVGAEKPDPRIFRAGLEKLGTAPDETCMIGDDWKKDIAGGTGAGLRSYWLGGGGVPPGHPLAQAVPGFRELLELLS